MFFQVIGDVMHSFLLKLTGIAVLCWLAGGAGDVFAQDRAGLKITGSVQNQDLRRIPQAIVQVRDQEGTVVADGVTNDAGEFSVAAPGAGTYSVSAANDTYRSEYVVVKILAEAPAPIKLTLAGSREIALEIVSPLPPIQFKASSETYSVSRKDVEALPRGNNVE